jgi:hypothetical protein
MGVGQNDEDEDSVFDGDVIFGHSLSWTDERRHATAVSRHGNTVCMSAKVWTPGVETGLHQHEEGEGQADDVTVNQIATAAETGSSFNQMNIEN